ncbi:DUF3617 domain-containing protein [Tsuneonella dongtanensis]|uniref:DUF3617 domain-containing protein n=1 Tax=Tsuneonella dongtanensis TaxID=692370 RepID=UPI00082E33ED|nr:DUF3617 domain-containing protein [Tsuneonella dongtanensis]
MSAVAAVLALTACGSEPSEPRTVDEVIAEAGELDSPRPGQYETKVELIEFSIPGLPPQQADQMKSMMGKMQAENNAYCLTEAEAKKGFEDQVRKMTQGEGQMDCQFGRFDVDGGKLDAQLTCKGPQGMTAEMTLDGTTGAESSSMHMTMVQKAAMIPGGEMRMEMKMDSKRVGECLSAGA